ncbi:MAG: recombination mediator RecR [Muribaculaceae bacterium]|nr:recombination mediator RecR [Muribaculaceae bacterium]
MTPQQQFSSSLLETAVSELAKLPGVGRKTALRLALHLLRREPAEGEQLGLSIIKLCNEIKYCKVCHNISEDEVCDVCSNPRRDSSIICVVENVQDVMHIERTGQFRGLYHVLNGLISPMDGIGPDQLQINSLVERVKQSGVVEVILALSATMEGDTTNYYIYRMLRDTGVKITQLARGVQVGNEIEYTDEITLGRSLLNRTPFGD